MSRKNKPLESPPEAFVVGVGASAGGLEALQDFFVAMPLDTGASFVVIQHLSPDYRSLMDELLARHTSIPIVVSQDGMALQKNHIYLLPPRKNIKIFRNQFFLEDQNLKKRAESPSGHLLPVPGPGTGEVRHRGHPFRHRQ